MFFGIEWGNCSRFAILGVVVLWRNRMSFFGVSRQPNTFRNDQRFVAINVIKCQIPWNILVFFFFCDGKMWSQFSWNIPHRFASAVECISAIWQTVCQSVTFCALIAFSFISIPQEYFLYCEMRSDWIGFVVLGVNERNVSLRSKSTREEKKKQTRMLFRFHCAPNGKLCVFRNIRWTKQIILHVGWLFDNAVKYEQTVNMSLCIPSMFLALLFLYLSFPFPFASLQWFGLFHVPILRLVSICHRIFHLRNVIDLSFAVFSNFVSSQTNAASKCISIWSQSTRSTWIFVKLVLYFHVPRETVNFFSFDIFVGKQKQKKIFISPREVKNHTIFCLFLVRSLTTQWWSTSNCAIIKHQDVNVININVVTMFFRFDAINDFGVTQKPLSAHWSDEIETEKKVVRGKQGMGKNPLVNELTKKKRTETKAKKEKK